MSRTVLRKADNPHINDLLTVEEVVLLVGVSFNTLNYWYRWKRENPDHELAKLLPDPIKQGQRSTRYWKYSDIERISEFKHSIPKGRYGGILASVTQKYAKKKGSINDKKESTAESAEQSQS